MEAIGIPPQITQEELDNILDVQHKKIIKFDISGEKYECTEETLLPVKESLLGRVLYEDPMLIKDAKGYFFFDRNGKYFSYLLDFLRTKQQSWPKEDEIDKKMRKEFEFFEIPMDLFERYVKMK
jgi:hypothetical protein